MLRAVVVADPVPVAAGHAQFKANPGPVVVTGRLPGRVVGKPSVEHGRTLLLGEFGRPFLDQFVEFVPGADPGQLPVEVFDAHATPSISRSRCANSTLIFPQARLVMTVSRG